MTDWAGMTAAHFDETLITEAPEDQGDLFAAVELAALYQPRPARRRPAPKVSREPGLFDI